MLLFGFYLWSLLSVLSMGVALVTKYVTAKEEVPCKSHSMNAREYFTRINLVKIKNDGP